MATLPVTDAPRDVTLDVTRTTSDFRGLYVHVPFCVHKCHYCDFYSITRQSPERMARYVDLVLTEADLWSDADTEFRTIFFGGGTPSLLPADDMARLVRGLRDRLDLSRVDEFTVEVNPNHVTPGYFETLRDIGVTRVSLGAQSFVPAELQALERDHEPACVAPAVEAARDAGIARQSIDLIHAIPGQTAESLAVSLDAAIATGVDHVSCYALTYEPNTPLYVRRRLGRVVATPEDEELDLFRLVRRRLSDAGLSPYETSNFATPGFECRHNVSCWSGDDYLGLGPAAASHASGVRWRNEPHLGRWERRVGSDILPVIEAERLSPADRAAELAWLNLRMTRGIDSDDFAARTGDAVDSWFGDALPRLAEAGLIESDVTSIRLTTRGVELTDAIAAELFAAACAET
ncbi:MAG: radical SAM family heme chaperone HemW [Planctomycetota bacterium]